MESKQVAGYSEREAAKITAGAVFAARPSNQQQIEEILSEMASYGNQRTVAVQYVQAMVAAERAEDFDTYLRMSKALTRAINAEKKDRGIK